MIRRPTLLLPQPLRAAEIPSFTNYSVVVRLPDIARRTLAENPFPPETVARIQTLIDEIPDGKVRQVYLPFAPYAEEWEQWIAPYAGMNWLEIPWFFAEEYFYIRILEATGYFAAGEWQGRDPYEHQKRLGLESMRDSLRTLAGQLGYVLGRPASTYRDSLARLLLVDLWGNQNDLSMWPVKVEHAKQVRTGKEEKIEFRNGRVHAGDTGSMNAAQSANRSDDDPGTTHAEFEAAQEHILSNDLDKALAYFCSPDPANTRVDILLDNAGYELVTDLALADFLLSSQITAQVTLHAKCYPVFVSDALEKDIHDTLDFLVFEGSDITREMAIRLRTHLVKEKLRLRHHPFWTSPLPAWDMPLDLQQEMQDSALMISKGDANYRRLFGDLHWPMDLPFSQVVDYLPFGVLALRTLKSEIAVGVSPENVPLDDPDWMVNGRWGLVQFAPPADQ